MLDPKKVANNILDFLIDPTLVPVKDRVYFSPEENLQNDVYENAKADAQVAYKNQHQNSDFYPKQNREQTPKGVSIMDRKALIASLSVLAKNFKDASDPFASDLQNMAYALSKMSDDAVTSRLASDAQDLETVLAADTFKCPKCGTNVLEKTGYCVKCKAKVKEASEEVTAAETFKCPKCGTNVLEKTGYCVKCKAKVKEACECVCAGDLNLQKVLDAFKSLTPADAKAVAKAYKEQKGKKLASEVVAKIGLGGKALIALAALLALANSAKAGVADTLANSLSAANVKEDIVELNLPKEDFKLPLLTDASRIIKEFEASKDVPTEMSGPSHPQAPAQAKQAYDFCSKEASDIFANIVARTLVAEVVGIVAKKEEPKKEEVKKDPEDTTEEAVVVVEAKKEDPKKEEVKEEEKPVVEAAKKEEPKKEEEKPIVEAAKVVDTDILASYQFAGIDVPVNALDEIGELSTEEKANLARLF